MRMLHVFVHECVNFVTSHALFVLVICASVAPTTAPSNCVFAQICRSAISSGCTMSVVGESFTLFALPLTCV